MGKIFLIGHRGTGKSTILKDYANKVKSDVCYDLDAEIELRKQVKIQTLFETHQASKFRELERKVLQNLIADFEDFKIHAKNQNIKLVVSLGAGFELEKFQFPQDAMILWLRRVTDSNGRIFSDRPALTHHKNPLEEWKNIFKVREQKYKKYSNAQVYIPEFHSEDFNALYEYLNFKPPQKGYVTYLPGENDLVLKNKNCHIELRTDLVSEEEIFDLLKKNSQRHYIIAIRDKGSLKVHDALVQNTERNHFIQKIHKLRFKNKIRIDWDMDLGLPSKTLIKLIDIYSSHGDDPLLDILILEDFLSQQKIQRLKIEYKICPEMSSHEDALSFEKDLKQILGHKPFSYLPRSKNEFNLSYHREIKSYSQNIGFYRFGEGTSNDQPYWWQWPSKKPKGFYGIYGENIRHSYTPAFHLNFFRKKKLSPISIESFKNFFNYIEIFKKYGLKALAVTSPYKIRAYNFILEHQKSLPLKNLSPKNNTTETMSFEQGAMAEATHFQSVNTLIFFNTEVKGYNTDIIGLKKYLEAHINLKKPVIIWGGGALLEQLKYLCPAGYFYSAQSAQVREGFKTPPQNVSKTEIKLPLIWASGEKGLLPDEILENFMITQIIDLDYRENSKAKLYSALKSIKYVSGLEFFIKQGQAQQKIWDLYEF